MFTELKSFTGALPPIYRHLCMKYPEQSINLPSLAYILICNNRSIQWNASQMTTLQKETNVNYYTDIKNYTSRKRTKTLQTTAIFLFFVVVVNIAISFYFESLKCCYRYQP